MAGLGRELEVVFVVEDDVGGGCFAHAVGQSIVTQGDDLDELRRNIDDAVACHFGHADGRPPAIKVLLTPDS